MNLIEYVIQSTETFRERPLGPVDSLVFAQLSYVKFEAVLQKQGRSLKRPRMRIRDFARNEDFPLLFSDGITDEKNQRFLLAAAVSRRFRDIPIREIESRFSEDDVTQFAAMVFVLDDGTEYAAFRGTDGDLVGWKEDAYMTFMDEVPSQTLAVAYLNRISKGLFGGRKPLYVGGHSKGGNLAMYGGLCAGERARKRIKSVDSFDGPGFNDETAARLKPYREKTTFPMTKYLPQSSIVGILLESDEDIKIIDGGGLLAEAHEAYRWYIEDNDFCYLKELTARGEYFSRTFRDWYQSVTPEQRMIFVDTLYKLLRENDVNSYREVVSMSPRKLFALAGTVKGLDEETRKIFLQVLRQLAKFAVFGSPKSADKEEAAATPEAPDAAGASEAPEWTL